MAYDLSKAVTRACGCPLDFHRHGCDRAPDEVEDDEYHDANQHEFGGAFDGHTVTSDADPGL